MWFQEKYNKFANIYKNEHNLMRHCLSDDQCVVLQSHAAHRSQQKILTWESLKDMSNGFQGLCCNLLKVPLVEFCTSIRKYYPTSSM